MIKGPKGWTTLEEDLRDEYLLNGKSELILKKLADNSNNNAVIAPWENHEIEKTIEIAKKGELFSPYPGTMSKLYAAFDEFDIKDKNILVHGSSSFDFECVCLAYGAKPVTIVYENHIKFINKFIDVYDAKQYEEANIACDCGISISSIEHYGLGRYGDPIDPNLDIKAMQEIKGYIPKGGLFFLAIPLGKDYVVWNLHRVYGKHRLELLLDGWDLIYPSTSIDKISGIDKDTEGGAEHQPVLVLRNK